jgi:hypothetical protein
MVLFWFICLVWLKVFGFDAGDVPYAGASIGCGRRDISLGFKRRFIKFAKTWSVV